MFPVGMAGCAGLVVLTFSVGTAVGPPALGSEAPPNRLTAAEREAGWQLLFDGRTTTGWRSFKKRDFPAKGWVAENDCLKHVARGGGGDIITDAPYDSFELTFEWCIGRGANSGVKYLVSEDRDSALGHEYQLIDDVSQGTAKPGNKYQTASFYDVLPATAWKEPRPPGQFNESRIVIEGRRVEHWLNGLKTLEYELGSEAVRQAVANSKFRDVKGFGDKLRGHILLQDHGGEVRFRNVKLRELTARVPAP